MRIKQTADHSVREQNSNSILLTPNTCSFPLSTRSPDLDKKDIGSIQTPDSCWRFERWIISNWLGNSWVVQWLRLHASIAEGTGSNPGMGTKILNAAKHKQTKTKKERNIYIHTHTHTHIYISSGQPQKPHSLMGVQDKQEFTLDSPPYTSYTAAHIYFTCPSVALSKQNKAKIYITSCSLQFLSSSFWSHPYSNSFISYQKSKKAFKWKNPFILLNRIKMYFKISEWKEMK